MGDTKRTKLERELAGLTTRQQAKTVQLEQARADLAAVNENLSTEANGAKWEELSNKHMLNEARISSLLAESGVLANKIRAVRLEMNDYDLAIVAAELSSLYTEGTGIRLRSDTMRNEFRVLCTRPQGDMETRQAVLNKQNEIKQMELAGALTMQHVEAAGRRRVGLLEERAAIG